MSATAMLWTAITPFLLVVWLVQRIPGVRGTVGLLLALAVGLGVVFIEWSGQWLPFWSASLRAEASAVMVVLLAVGIWQRAGLLRIFRAREWQAAWIFGSLAALVLYPSALGLGWRNLDAYSLGWPWLEWAWSVLLFGPVAVTAGVLVLRGNRFGWVLALASGLYLLRVSESHNFWDCLVDPLYATASLVSVAIMIGRRLLPR